MSTPGRQRRQQVAFSSRQAEGTNAQTSSIKQEGKKYACNHSPKELRGPEFAFGNARKIGCKTGQANAGCVHVWHDAVHAPRPPASPRWQQAYHHHRCFEHQQPRLPWCALARAAAAPTAAGVAFGCDLTREGWLPGLAVVLWKSECLTDLPSGHLHHSAGALSMFICYIRPVPRSSLTL